jgi:hypothetical protein
VNFPAVDLHGGSRIDRLENVFGIPEDRLLRLSTFVVDVLLEVAFPVEKSDPHHRHAQISGGP